MDKSFKFTVRGHECFMNVRELAMNPGIVLKDQQKVDQRIVRRDMPSRTWS